MVTESAQLTTVEVGVLQAFRDYLVRPGEMLCFNGPCLVHHQRGLQSLIEKQLLSRERFAGAYTLTEQGVQTMRKLKLRRA
jgi:hypothetical protein